MDHHDPIEARAELAALRAEYASRLAELDARLAALGHVGPEVTTLLPAEAEGGGAPAGMTEPVEPPVGELMTDRRGMLRRVGMVAAGGVAGGVAAAVAGASPAAAAISDTGNPAILGTANPVSGVGVQGVANGTGTGVIGSSATGIGVDGTTSTGTAAVRGTTGGTGTGVAGVSTSGNGVQGTGGIRGVLGTATGGIGAGVEGIANAGAGSSVGVRGVAIGSPDGIGVVANGSLAPLRLLPNTSDPQLTLRSHQPGELYYSSSTSSLWVCVGQGTPGTWRRLASVDTAGALQVLPTPVRVYDSRTGFLPATGPKSPLAPNTARRVDVTLNGSGVPEGATAVLLSLIVASTSASGFLAVYQNGIPWPGTSNLVWNGSGTQQAVTAISALNASGEVAVYANVATEVIVDVAGYFL